MKAARLRAPLRIVFFLTLLAGLPAGIVFRRLRQDKLDSTLVHAIQQRRVASALALLESGANPNACFEQAVSPWQACRQVWERLWSHAPAPPKGDSALMLAVQSDQPLIALALLSRGATGLNAQIDVQNWYEHQEHFPLLSAATLQGRPEIAKALLDKGADINAKGPNEETALLVALGDFYDPDRPPFRRERELAAFRQEPFFAGARLSGAWGRHQSRRQTRWLDAPARRGLRQSDRVSSSSAG